MVWWYQCRTTSTQTVYEYIAQILNNVAETGNKPKKITLGQLIPLPKPGKPKDREPTIQRLLVWAMGEVVGPPMITVLK